MIKNKCPHAGKCGGCQLPNLEYGEQLALKQSTVIKQLGRFCRVRPIIGMENPYHYRGKVQAAFGLDRARRVISGVYQASTHKILPTDQCLLEDKTADEIIVSVRKMLPDFGLTAYDERTGRGFLRHVLVRRGFATGEIMVVLVAAAQVFTAQKPFAQALVAAYPDIKTIVLNVNNRKTSLVLGEKEKVIYGRGYIEDIICGKRFRISACSFCQVNPIQTEVLYREAIDAAGLTGRETVIDAYCGTGTIGIIAADRAARVIGAELNSAAVRDAAENARLNKAGNCRFVCADAGDFMQKYAADGGRIDVAFLDPPRAGSSVKFLRSLAAAAPERVVYVSCNPETLSRDLRILSGLGYRALYAQPVDMFPHTAHIECVVSLVRKAPRGEKPKE